MIKKDISSHFEWRYFFQWFLFWFNISLCRTNRSLRLDWKGSKDWRFIAKHFEPLQFTLFLGPSCVGFYKGIPLECIELPMLIWRMIISWGPLKQDFHKFFHRIMDDTNNWIVSYAIPNEIKNPHHSPHDFNVTQLSTLVHCCRLLRHGIRPWILDFGNMGPGGLLKGGARGPGWRNQNKTHIGWWESNWLCNLNTMSFLM